MKWSLQQLQKLYKFPHIVNAEYDFKDYLEQIKNSGVESDILDCYKCSATISINQIDMNTYQFDYKIIADLSIACALTLEPVDYKIDINVSETYSTIDSDDEEIFPIEGNTIDTKMIIWSNIVLNIPIRVVREDAYEILKSRNIILDEELPEED